MARKGPFAFCGWEHGYTRRVTDVTTTGVSRADLWNCDGSNPAISGTYKSRSPCIPPLWTGYSMYAYQGAILGASRASSFIGHAEAFGQKFLFYAVGCSNLITAVHNTRANLVAGQVYSNWRCGASAVGGMANMYAGIGTYIVSKGTGFGADVIQFTAVKYNTDGTYSANACVTANINLAWFTYAMPSASWLVLRINITDMVGQGGADTGALVELFYNGTASGSPVNWGTLEIGPYALHDSAKITGTGSDAGNQMQWDDMSIEDGSSDADVPPITSGVTCYQPIIDQTPNSWTSTETEKCTAVNDEGDAQNFTALGVPQTGACDYITPTQTVVDSGTVTSDSTAPYNTLTDTGQFAGKDYTDGSYTVYPTSGLANGYERPITAPTNDDVLTAAGGFAWTAGNHPQIGDTYNVYQWQRQAFSFPPWAGGTLQAVRIMFETDASLVHKLYAKTDGAGWTDLSSLVLGGETDNVGTFCAGVSESIWYGVNLSKTPEGAAWTTTLFDQLQVMLQAGDTTSIVGELYVMAQGLSLVHPPMTGRIQGKIRAYSQAVKRAAYF